MKKHTFLLILLVLTTLATNTTAQNKPSRGDTIVTSTFTDIDTAANLFYTMRSDSGGDYVNGTASVASAIQGIGDWDFDLLQSPNRQVFFDFSSPIAGTNTDNVTAPGSGAYSVRALAQCSVRGKKLQDLKLNGPSIDCPVNFQLKVGSETYSLRFRTVEYPGATDVKWSCTSSVNGTDTGACNGWRMESAPGGSIARLLKLTTAKGKITTKAGSLFHFTFKVDLRTP